MKTLTLAFFLFATAKAMACIESPKNFSLTGASFNDSVQINVTTNCRATWRFKYGNATHSITSKEGKICLHTGESLLSGEKTCGTDLVKVLPSIKDSEGRVVGIFETSGSDLLLFSTKDGKKDILAPYMKIAGREDNEVRINVMENSKVIGGVHSVSNTCTRSLGGSQSDKTLELRGTQYTSTTGGCHGGFNTSAITFKGSGTQALEK